MPPKDRRIEVVRALWRQLPEGMRSRAQPLVRRVVPVESRPGGAADGNGGKPRPLLSVVVPIYNVEEYLQLCLASLARQPVARMEIIIVDDGSTDGSLAIAQAYAAEDDRFTIIRQPNAGLGAARNTGIAHATGKYLGFADSDDVVPDGSYEAMLAALKGSGSDFAVGSIRRLAGERRRHSAWAAELHAVRRAGITINELPCALQDVFAWNKIFDRAFWDTHIGWFPEGLLYEDQEVSSKAFLRATAFDVLPEVVYEWRIRSDRSSITQQKSSIKDLRDRVTVIGHMQSLMQAEAEPAVKDTWLAKVLGRDLGYYYRQIPRVGDDYWQELQRATAALAARSGAAVWRRMKVMDRIIATLVAEDCRADAETVLLHQAQHGNSFPVEVHYGRLLAQPGFLGQLKHDIPRNLLEVGADALQLQARLVAVRQHPDGSIELDGVAHLPGIDPGALDSGPAVRLRDGTGRSIMDLPARQIHDGPAGEAAAAAGEAGSAFRTLVRPGTFEALRPEEDDPAGPEWWVEMSRTVAGTEFTAAFQGRDRSGTAATLPLLPVTGQSRVDVGFDSERGLVFRTVPIHYTADRIHAAGRTVTLDVTAANGEPAQDLVLEGPGGSHVSGRPETTTSGRSRFGVELPELQGPGAVNPAKPHSWRIRVRSASGQRYPVSWPGTSEQWRRSDSSAEPLQVSTTVEGHLEVREYRLAVVADSVSIDGDEITVSGRASTRHGPVGSEVISDFHLTPSGPGIAASDVAFAGDGRFTARFPVHQVVWGRPAAAPAPGSYVFHCELRSDRAGGGSRPGPAVPVSPDFESSLPQLVQTPSCTIRVARTAVAGNLSLRVSAPAAPAVAPGPDAAGPSSARHANPAAGTRVKPAHADATFFESFSGRAAADSGLAIHRELMRRGDERPKYWSVTDLSVAVPDGGTAVVRFSRQWYELLGSAGHLVNNGFFPPGFRKQPGQTYVQTWHGTPLKRVGHDGPTAHLSLGQLAALNQEPAEWDALLVQNDFAARVLPAALRFSGQLVAAGYPRNDSLVTAEPGRRSAIRQLLGISNEQTAVLYLPTWRDRVTDFNKPHGHVDLLEPALLRAGLGGHWMVMRRSHPDMTGQQKTLSAPDLDVSGYPDGNDLYLAADVLVTDYSSVMFDFCHTGKPMYFLAPDLQSFGSGRRGFYLDPQTVVPGPVVGDTSELAAALKGARTPSWDYRERLEAFVSRFAGNDDGGAAGRVVDALW